MERLVRSKSYTFTLSDTYHSALILVQYSFKIEKNAKLPLLCFCFKNLLRADSWEFPRLIYTSMWQQPQWGRVNQLYHLPHARCYDLLFPMGHEFRSWGVQRVKR
jgi:hypothetical protein